MKKLFSHLILLLTVFFSYSSQAYEILEASFNDDDLLLPIPDGYCDATDDLVGIFAMDYILKTDEITKYDPIPKVVFTRCGFENDLDENYPWGYIGLQNISTTSLTQAAFNEEMSQILADSKLMDKFNEVSEDMIEKKWSEEYGDDVSEYNFGEFRMLYSNENIVLLEMQNKILTQGQIFLENVIASATILSKTAVYYYIYELESGKTTILENASTLIDNSKRLKRIN